MKLGLGTVQFGMDYGISNAEGATSVRDVEQILEFASGCGISVLDTAAAYAESEAALGRFYPQLSPFSIVTKTVPLNIQTITDIEVDRVVSVFESSLAKMRQSQLYGLLVHQADNLLAEGGDRLYARLQSLKESGKVKKIGVSVYDRATLSRILDRYSIDLVQIPLNVFDQRFLEDEYLKYLKKANIEIHSRSVFLQGLLLMRPEQLSAYFSPILSHVKAYQAYLDGRGISLLEGALGFALALEELDVVLCGVNNPGHLEEIAGIVGNTEIDPLDLSQFSIRDETMINPALWST